MLKKHEVSPARESAPDSGTGVRQNGGHLRIDNLVGVSVKHENRNGVGQQFQLRADIRLFNDGESLIKRLC